MHTEKDSVSEEKDLHNAKHANHEPHTHEQPVETASEEITENKITKVVNIKMAIVVALVIILGAVLYSARGLFIAATVNGSMVSRIEVISALEKSAGKKALEAIITKKLIADAVRKEGGMISVKEIDEEVKSLEEQVAASGNGTLPELLALQGMSIEDLRGQIMIQKQLEKLLGDKVVVTDKEVEDYITSNNLTIPKEQLEAAYAEIRDQLEQQKMSTEGQKFVTKLMSDAKISYFVKY